ncbi:MFS transporter [Dinoroseobacter sp. S124A]|uniref:MFS transporter n=1 Tax=Dinoroseobacter sp. S124A TaxID=3415128 RepID=UPI003C7C890A
MTQAPSHTRWPLVFLLWGAGLGAAAQYGKVSVVFDQLPQLFPEAGTLLGWVVSLVGGVGILLGVTAGVVVARLTVRRALVWGLWLGAAVSLLQGLAPPLWLFLLSRLLEGLSHLAIVVAAPTLIASLSATRDRGVTLTLWGTFFGVAFAILTWLGLPLAAWLGVPALFAAHGVFMAAAALAIGAALPKEPAPTGPLWIKPDLGALWAKHVQIYRSPRLGAPAAGWLFYTFCFVSLLTLLPPYLDPAQRTFLIGAMPLVSITASLTLGVWLLRRVSSVTVIQIGFLSSAVCAVALIIWPGHAVLCLIFAACLGLVQGASFASVPDLNPTAEGRILSNGAMAQTGNIGNTLGTPVLFAISVGLGYSAMLITLGFVLCLGAMAHGVLALRRRAEG